MRIRVFLRLILPVILVSRFFPVLAGAQGGDQFLDGIGETALVARYVFAANTEDSSRNHFHATLRGSGAAFVEDPRFGRALELVGQRQPRPASRQRPGRRRHDQRHGLVVPADRRVRALLRFRAERVDQALRGGDGGRLPRVGRLRRDACARPTAAAVPVNQWIHVAVVLDPARRVLTTYLDGARVGQATNVAVDRGSS